MATIAMAIPKTTRFDFATTLLKKLNWKTDVIEPASMKDFDFSKKMPIDSSLNTKKALHYLKNPPQSLNESIAKYLAQTNL